MKQKTIHGRSAAAIAASIEEAVRRGVYAPEQPLPPIRQLAATLRVSPVTVAAAYGQLQRRGLVSAGRRRGTRVRLQPAMALPAPSSRVRPEGMIDLASGDPDPELLPPLEPVLRSLSPRSALYGDASGFQPLVQFAADEFAADGIAADSIAVLNGALDAIERLLQEALRPGDRVAVEDPTVPALLDLLAGCGFVAEPIAVTSDGPEPASFEVAVARAKAVVVTPRAQNPTGAAMTPDRAVELRQVLRRREDVLLVENDHAGPVAGVPVVTLTGSHRRWAVVRSLSKSVGPDLRVAVVAGDPLTIGRTQARHALTVRRVSHLMQQIALSIWSDPSSGRRLARAADVYAQRRMALVEALALHGIATIGRSGFNLWIPVREETSAVQSLARAGWAVAAGERFRLRSGPGIRVTTSALGVDLAPRFAAACAQAVRPTRAPSA